MHSFRGVFPLLFALACAAGSRDVLDDGSHDVRADASAPANGAYTYAARRPLIAIGLASSEGLTDDEAHRAVDRVADEAAGCFKRMKELSGGAGRITLPIDEGGVTGSPQVTFSPPASAVQGMVCLLAPFRVSTFSPGKTARSITIEAAWGSDVH